MSEFPFTFQQTIEPVIQAIQVALSPTSNPIDRKNAHDKLDHFRSKATPVELCTVGMHLVTTTTSAELVLAGLQLLKILVEFHWAQFEFRNDVKAKLHDVFLLDSPVLGINYVQEGIARVIVEIAKKEWPQLWPDFLDWLQEGLKTSNIPLLVYRRLVEDVITLQVVESSTRRHELTQALSNCSEELINSLFDILCSTEAVYKETKCSSTAYKLKVILGTILPFIEWTNLSYFTANSRIPQIFEFLKYDEVKIDAANCIAQLLDRKSNRKEDKHCVPNRCLDEKCALMLLQSITICPTTDIQFLKKIGEVTGSLASAAPMNALLVSQLTPIIIALVQRDEVSSVLGGLVAYNNFLKNMERTLQGYNLDLCSNLHELLRLVAVKFLKPMNSSEKEEMALLKSQFISVLRTSSKADPKLYLSVRIWLLEAVNMQLTVAQWDVIAFILEAATWYTPREEKAVVDQGLFDLEHFFNTFTRETNLELKSSLLSVVSSLFAFLGLSKEREELADAHRRLTRSILETLFLCFNYSDTDEDSKSLRHHVASLLVKLGGRYHLVLVPYFDDLFTASEAMSSVLNSLESRSVMESLLLISNAWNDLNRQEALIARYLNQTEFGKISEFLQSPDAFINIISDLSTFNEARRLIFRDFNIVYCILRRVRIKKSEVKPIHPAYNYVRPLIPVILNYIRIIHSLVSYPNLQFTLELSEGEKSQIFGVQNSADYPFSRPSEPSQEPENSEILDPKKVKGFVLNTLECAYTILGESCILFTPQLYSVPDIDTAILNFVGHNLGHMNDFRVRNVLRNVVKPFLLSCPAENYPKILLPFFGKFTAFALDRLCMRWQLLLNSKNSEDQDEEQELLESSVLQIFSREYLELILRLLEKSTTSSSNTDAGTEGEFDNMETDMEMEDGRGSNSLGSSKVKQSVTQSGSELGDLGKLVLEDETCLSSIVNVCVASMGWDDSMICLRANRILLLSLPMILKDIMFIKDLLAISLRCLCIWTDNESNVDYLVRLIDSVYKTLHQTTPIVKQIFVEWGAPVEELDKLSLLCNDASKNEKKRKDLLRRLGKNNSNAGRHKLQKSWFQGLPKVNSAPKSTQKEIDLRECFSLVHG